MHGSIFKSRRGKGGRGGRGETDVKDSLLGTQGEILVIPKHMEALLLTSMELGFLLKLLKPKETILLSVNLTSKIILVIKLPASLAISISTFCGSNKAEAKWKVTRK